MDPLISQHFLSLPRPDVLQPPRAGVVDTTTLAAHDFDVDTRTGFMPPDPPLTRLPAEWESWEVILDSAQAQRLKLGKAESTTDEDRLVSASWRARVSELAVLPTSSLNTSELLLRRAHHVLAWIMHFYIHTLPSGAEVRIPAPITIPLLQVCAQLQLPPVVTYSDDVLYNWALKEGTSPGSLPTIDNLRCLTLFTGTKDEEEFYLSSARIELRGVEALDLMRATMDELFVGDNIAMRRITRYLRSLSSVIDELSSLLLTVRDGCAPDVFYRDIRPWFAGHDSAAQKWHFEGLDDHPELAYPTELSGPSAGQSSLVHALDIFLGVHEYSHSATLTGHYAPKPASTSTSDSEQKKVAFLERMQSYMPRHHRNFLRHLSSDPRPLRQAVERSTGHVGQEVREAYNAAVRSMKAFRDAHMRIVALYIIGPSRRFNAPGHDTRSTPREDGDGGDATANLKGTGGTDLVRFLKGVRDRTAGAIIETASSRSSSRGSSSSG